MPTLRSLSAPLTGPDGRLATVYLLAAGLAIVVHRLLPTGSLEQNVLYDVIGIATVVAVLVGIRRNRPPRVLPWLLIAGSQLLFVTGDALWTILELLGESPFPSIADVAYLLGYPLLVIAFAVAIRLRVRGGDQSGLLDGSILAAASALVGWVVLVRPVLDSADDPLSLVVSAAYPLADLLVLGIAIGLLATPGSRTPSFVLLISSIGLLFLADTAYAFQVATDAYVDGGVLDTLWLASYVTIGAAALHGSMREVAAPHPVAVAWLSRVRLSFLALAMLTGPALVLIVDLRWDSDVPILAIGSACLSILVLVRLSTVVGALARDNAARVQLEGELSYRASHDPLTGLPNRRRFIERLEGVLALPVKRPLAVLFLDLDDFKTVNDSLGHAAGDALLVGVATRIQRHVREEDLAARLGGDEFGIILDGKDATAAARVADRLLAALDTPIDVDGRQLVARASIGIVDGAKGATAAQLLSDADIAMYQAKAEGKSRARIYRPGTRTAVQDRLELESDLRDAIGRGELRLEYQPIMRLATGRTVGLEALVRWEHPTRGRLDPGAFIPLAEAAGLITELGAWVLREGCRQLAGWRTGLDKDLLLSVNLSARQLVEPTLAATIDAAVRAAGVPADALIVEVTESALLEDSDIVLRNLDSIRATGARVAIDDFGTGYSSLSYLSRLPADILKIDRAFVEELDRGGDRGLAAVVVRLGETLDLETIAEGVARPSQLHALRELGCDLAQGYLFAGPLAAASVTAWLTAEREPDGPEPDPDPAPAPARGRAGRVRPGAGAGAASRPQPA